MGPTGGSRAPLGTHGSQGTKYFQLVLAVIFLKDDLYHCNCYKLLDLVESNHNNKRIFRVIASFLHQLLFQPIVSWFLANIKAIPCAALCLRGMMCEA